MCQLLVTFDQSRNGSWRGEACRNTVNTPSVTVWAFYYSDAGASRPVQCPIRVLPGESPARLALGNHRDKFEFQVKRYLSPNSINYQSWEPKTRPQSRNHEEIDIVDEFFKRVSKEIVCLPRKVKEKIRFEQMGDTFLLCLPLTKTCNLSLGITVRPNWEIISGCLGRTAMAREPRDITEWIACRCNNHTIQEIYQEVNQHFRRTHPEEKGTV
jgi:hypothetical protein